MEEQILRIKGFEEIDTSRICLWKTDDSYKWLLYLPNCGIGALGKHTVIENQDGTISVTPSILVTGHERGQKMTRHGYITNDVWRE